MIRRVGRIYRYARRGEYREDKREPEQATIEVKAEPAAKRLGKR